ncbi:protein kinase domain-containing protein [Streptomyces aureocirculatus]|uniref:protein kinase domain-containing protein n=1 Tax=Streptomyces aureocirculatus TaxID=67275 RepID=UPI00069087AD|nr:PQQ-binding-like beta-propeller repeat protein [Streptomyces aureocirculatus]
MTVTKPLLDSDPRRLGPYRLVGVLGRGGMGEVFLARDRRGQLVAVKRVRPSLVHERDARRRFAREVAAARRVESPLVAQVLDAAPEADQPWLATEYVPGIALSEAVDTYGPLPEPYVRAIARQLTDALAAIHRAGLVHRDFKPSNVLLSAHGPRVLDFGVARHLHASTFTTSQAFLGTPAFAAPEQWDAAGLTGAADVFSLASTLVFALRKRAPFDAEDMWRVMYAIRFDEPDLSDLPCHWQALTTRCLAKDPARRPTLAELATALDHFPSAGEDVVLPDGLAELLPAPAGPRPPGPRPRGPEPGPGRREVLRAGAAVLFGAGCAGLVAGDRRAGAEVWTFRTHGAVHQLLAADGTLYAVDSVGYVYALDARTGECFWSEWLDTGSTWPRLGGPAVGAPALYVTGDTLYALNPTSGQERWNLGLSAAGAPVVTQQAVCVITPDAHGTGDELALVDPYLGEQISVGPDGLAARVRGGRDAFTAPAAVDDTTLVIGERRGTRGLLHRVSLANRRDHHIVLLPGDALPAPAAPLLRGGIAYLGTTGPGAGLAAVDVHTMRPVWSRPLGPPGETWSTPVFDDVTGLVHLTGRSSGVHAVDRSTGEPAWTHRLTAPTPSTPALADAVLYVLTLAGDLIALNTRDRGTPVQRRSYAPFPTGTPAPAPVTAHGLVHFATADRVVRAVPQTSAPTA